MQTKTQKHRLPNESETSWKHTPNAKTAKKNDVCTVYSRKEIETRILEKKSKQKISRFIDLIYRYFNIMLGSNWLIFSPMGGQEYIDISRYYVVKSRFLS